MQVPRRILQFFRWYCHPDYVEDIEGDLYEKYSRNYKKHGKQKADWLFFRAVLSLFRIGLMRPISIHNYLIHSDMLKQNLKIGFRTLVKNQSYSLIKIGGFAIGIAVFLLLSLYIKHELAYDQHYQHSNRIFRVLNTSDDPEEREVGTAFPAQVGQILNENFPEIEVAARLIPYDWNLAGNNQLRKSEAKRNNYEEGFAYADPALLDILEIPMVFGDAKTALEKPYTLVISKKKADKYYPNENPVGKTIFLNENTEEPYTIGGVMEDFPTTSHIQFDFFITLTEVEFWPGEQTNWCCWNYNPYIRVKEGADLADLEKKLLLIRDEYIVPYMLKTENIYADKAEKYFAIKLQPIKDIHLKSTEIDDIFKNSDLQIVKLFGLIALFILLLSCTNFINLFTAKSANRAKEIGVRKVAGSLRGNLIQQFLTESMLYSGIALIFGILLTYLALPYFNQLIARSLIIPWTAWWLIPSLLGLSLFIGFLAGIYPAFYLSGFRPIEVLKGNLSKGSKNSNLRNSLVVFQFSISIILVVSAFVVFNQMQFILNKKLGYNKEQVLMLKGVGTLEDKMPVFKKELERISEVESVTSSSFMPVSGTKRNGNQFWKAGRRKLDMPVGGQAWRVDENYITTMKMNLLKGRNLSKDLATDTASVIINETMVKRLGLENPIGAQIQNWDTWTVVGVVEDFHFESIKGGIGPLAFFLDDGGAIISTRIKTEDMDGALAAITNLWDQFMPNQPLRYTYMDEAYASMYEDVQRTGNLFATCAILAIIIACLGLFGLSTFMAEQRNKEISIRKVLGASVSSLYQLLVLNYVKLIFISLFIGMPIAWYIMQKWLSTFTYKIDMLWWFFAASSAFVIVIALITVSRQALKLSLTNPAEFLKKD